MKLGSIKVEVRTVFSACLLFVASAHARADLTVTSAPVGVLSASVPVGQRGLAFPLIAENVFVGVASGNSGTTIDLNEASADPRPVLVNGRAYYVEVLTGALEGERFDLDVAGTLAGNGANLALTLTSNSNSTVAQIAGGALANARVAIRPHVTLAALQTMLSPALVGSKNAGGADGVQIFEGGVFVRYYLSTNGSTWLRNGNSPTDYRNKIVPPDSSILLDLSSGAKSWTHAGVVRTNAFRKNLGAGQQSFASGFPLAVSFVEVGGFVDLAAPSATRWTGASLSDSADWFQRFGVSGSMPFNRYFLREDGMTWQRVNDPTNVAHSRILSPTGMYVLRRILPDPAYVIPVPFAL